MWLLCVSATPPLEAIRLVLSLAMTKRPGIEEDRVLSFLDISRAHPHCDALRENLYVDLPREAGCPEGYCALLKKSLYGLRAAKLESYIFPFLGFFIH